MTRGSMSPFPPPRIRPLHLPTPGVPQPGGQPTARPRRKRRRAPSRWKHLGVGLACVAGGTLILAMLTTLAERFNTLLLVSQAVANLIRGLSLLATGLLQILALLTVAALALFALLLLVGGLARLVRAVSGALAARQSRAMPISHAAAGPTTRPAARTTKER